MKNNELPVYIETYNLALDLERMLVNFPKYYSRTYADRMRNLLMDMITEICIANTCTSSLQERSIHLQKAIGSYDAFKFAKRICFDLRLLSIRQSSVIDAYIGRIGKQLMGWKMGCEKK